MLLLSDRVWVSPGQWGSWRSSRFLMACVGGLVVNRAARSDVTFAFIACYCALVFGRSLYLGEPLTIPLHRLQSGALLLFTFFMISDPKTTPDSRAGRVLFAALVAFGAWYVQFRLFRTNGLLWSLALWSAAVPLIDRLLPGARYAWIARPRRPNLRAGRIAMKRNRARHFALVNADRLRRRRRRRLGFCGFYVAKADTKLFNQRLAGRAGARRRSDRADDGQRLSGRA